MDPRSQIARSNAVLCMGLIVADHVSAPIAAIPASGGLTMTDRLELTIGGCAANVATDLARLGVDVGIVGRIGADVLGTFVKGKLETAGVACGHLSASPTSQTSATLIVNVRGEDRRFIHALGANAELTGLECSASIWSSTKVAYVGGIGLNAALTGENVSRIFQIVRSNGGCTVLDVVVGDPDLARKLLPQALAQTDYFLPNQDEGRLLTGESDVWKQAEAFLCMGARHVIITRGAAGLIFANNSGRKFEFDPYPVQQVDGTGGGDAFAAGLIYGLLQGAEMNRCLMYGAALGASCVRMQGATTGVFNEAELLEFIARTSQHMPRSVNR